MSADEGTNGRVVDFEITYCDPADITRIADGMLATFPPRRIHKPAIGEAPQLIVAGSIALRILVSGLIDWAQKLRGTTIVVDATRAPGELVIRPVESRNVTRVIVVGPDRREVFDLTGGKPDGVEDAMTAAIDKVLGT
jgi:hypothetical protein